MLSYRHSFHAGNHADVLKHSVLSLIITALKEKEKPFLYLDTHAGAGNYRLAAANAQKTAEYQHGIELLWQRDDTPALLQPYLSTVAHYNRHHPQLRHYPGSPLLAQHLLREQDKLWLTELHPSDYPLLRQHFANDPRAKVSCADGFAQLKAVLPPVMRRGLIVIDPAYEVKSDYQQVVTTIADGYKRFATGVYALWYPVVHRPTIKRLLADLQATGMRNILQIELAVLPDNQQRGMTASGMIVINPPWRLASQMESLLPWLHQVLSPQKQGHFLLEQRVAE